MITHEGLNRFAIIVVMFLLIFAVSVFFLLTPEIMSVGDPTLTPIIIIMFIIGCPIAVWYGSKK
jgi:hypothetical protein